MRKTLAIWQSRAEAGDPEAQYCLGKYYTQGLHIAPDYPKAADWYRRAAEADYPRALNNYGVLLVLGRGVPVNTALAARYFLRAAAHGLPRAKHNLRLLLQPAPTTTAATCFDDD